MIYPQTTFSGQKVSITNRYIRLFQNEHNEHADGVLARALRAELMPLIPFKYHGFRIIYLSVIWEQVLSDISEMDRPVAGAKFKETLQQVRKFGKWQRNHFRPTVKRLFKERNTARQETRQDNRHSPTLANFSMVNGRRRMDLPSKNPNVNEATNIAFAERFLHLHSDAPKEYIEAANEALAEAKQQAYDSDHWDSELDMEAIRLNADMQEPPDPFEDFQSDYTLTQTDGKLAIPSANRINFTAYDRGHDGIVYRNKGAGHFGNFEHLVDVHITGSSDNGWIFPFHAWTLANAIGTRKELNDLSEQYLSVIYGTNRINNLISLFEFNGLGAIDTYTFGSGLDSHFHNIGRDGTAGTADIYSDIDRTSVLANLSGTVGADVYSTVYGFQAADDVITGDNITGNIRNLDLQEAIAVLRRRMEAY